MIIKDIQITNFRNYKNINVSFNPNINIIYGNNGEGKTNLLESIFVLGLTKSHRSLIDNYLINKQSQYARISGVIKDEILTSNLEVILESNKKHLKIDDKPITKVSDYISKMNVIIFYPEDLELIKGSPMERRKYLNIQLSQIHVNYIKILNDYNKLLKQRNEMLKNYQRTKQIDEDYFEIVTDKLINRGFKIYQYRENYITNINENIDKIYMNIMGLEGLKIIYKTIYNKFNEEPSNLLQKYKETMLKSYESDLKVGTTLIGPHRDDFEFVVNNSNLKSYGSQGQQRGAVLSLKLSEIPIFKSYKTTYPILLLDDVFSELDDFKKNNILKYIGNNIQTFITTTDLKSLNKSIIEKSKIIKIEKGNVVSKGEI